MNDDTAKKYHIEHGGTISPRNMALVHFLEDYYAHYTLDAIAWFLRTRGWWSKSGVPLTASHISNFLRKDLGLRKVGDRPYYKPKYQGRNWITG